ncbi:MAG: TonB-dependent receptor [Muribaculaceae bacterium]|nr:TonB-dependent receptor [Muribaculaceae bacterium]
MNALLVLSALMASQGAQTVAPTDSVADMHDDLQELVVVAKKEVIKSDGASLTYDLSEDDSTKGTSLLDALKKVPMVTVDGQDVVYINGDSNFKICVNGKEDPMLQANYSRIFKSMPADAVQKIEVITEPGAKYDAEGSGGVLNLITETKQRKDGYSGTVNASLSNRDYNLSFFGRMKYDKFSLDANVTYAGDSFSDQTTDQTHTNINDSSDINHRQLMKQNQRIGFNFLNAGLNASWEPNEKNLFTFGGSFMNLNGKIKGYHSTTGMYDRDDILQWQYSQNVSGNLKMLSASANASYQHSFDSAGHRLVLAYLYNFGRNPLDLTTETSDPINYEIYSPFTNNISLNYNREHTFQIDYANPFGGEKHKLEAGAKVIFRHNTATGESGAGDSPTSLTLNPELSVDMLQLQDIYALYAAYNGHFGNLSANAGLRYEHTRMGIRNRLDETENFTRHLNDLVPNAALTYLFSPASNLRLAYQMRITRPDIKQMSPYQQTAIGTMVQEGNPNLESEHSNRISLTYTNFGSILGGNIFADYKYTNNAITQFAYYNQGDEGSMILHQTTANIGHSQEFGLGGFLNVNLTQKMTFSVNGRLAYVKMISSSPLFKNHGWTGNYGANWNYTIPGDIKLSAYGGQTFHVIQLQGSYSGWYYYGLGLSKGFLNDKITVALNASSFLQSSTPFHSNTHSGNQHTYTDVYSKSWRVGISLTWNFGHLNSSAKRTDLYIDNDDIYSSGGNGNGGISI